MGPKTFLTVFIVAAVNLSLYAGSVWVVGSVVTSGVKAGTKNCGKTYKIERVLAGDWFCED
jgi:hypothetical protein